MKGWGAACAAGVVLCMTSIASAQTLPCGENIPNTDLPGANLPGSGGTTDSVQDCLDLCTSTADCNAMIRVFNGACYLKNVPDDVAATPRNGMTSYIICDDTTSPAPSAEGCGGFVMNQDLPGANLPGSGADTASNQECLDLCTSTATCNAVVRVFNGVCYLKNVALDVAPTPRNGMMSYIFCDDTTPPPVDPPTAPPPSAEGCGEFVANQDLPGANLPGSGVGTASNQECLDLCVATTDCNAMIRVFNGVCYLKSVPVDVVPTPRNDMTSYIICDGTTPPPAGSLPAFFALDGCPASTPMVADAGRAGGVLRVNEQTRTAYEGPDSIIQPPLEPDEDLIPMTYNTLPLGGSYCDSGAPKILVGGTILFKQGGECVGMPLQADGSSCCTLQVWQPSSDGFYYDGCSMKQNLDDTDANYYFETEVPGDESVAGWGGDNAPHFHYDIKCRNCAAGSPVGTTADYFNKFYVQFAFAGNNGNTEALHLAEQSTYEGQEAHIYNIAIDA